MNPTMTVSDNQAAILGRSILPGDDSFSVAQAQFLADLHFSQRDVQRMNELAAKAREGTLGPDEEHLLDDYRHVGNVLETIKSRARSTLRQSGEPS